MATFDPQGTGQLADLTTELVGLQDQLAAIYELSQLFSGLPEPEEALHSLAAIAGRSLGTDIVAARLALPGKPVLEVSRPAGVGDAHWLNEAFAWARQHGTYRLQNEPGHQEKLPAIATGWLIQPLTIRGQVQGVLALAGKQSGPFTLPDVKLAQALTGQLDVLIGQSLWREERVAQALLQGQLDLARDVQRCLMPRSLPDVLGLEVWAASNSLHQVGGDFYDFIPGPEDGPTISLGDVCGKGVPAAMLMTMTRTTLRTAVSLWPQSSPARLVQHTNAVLCEDYAELGMFASLFVARYRPGDGRLHYANAGHAPVIFCPANGPARLLPAGNASIGLLPEADFIPASLPFGPGDVLVVATDGYTEATNDRLEMFDFDRLLETVTVAAGLDAAAIGAIVQAVVKAFRGQQPPADDQTLLVCKGSPI